MEIVHTLRNLTLKKKSDGNLGFLLTNQKGSYLSFFSEQSSRYNGLFYFDSDFKKMFKIIESINLIDCEKPALIKNGFYYSERAYKKTSEKFIMPSGLNSLIYELENPQSFDLHLDFKDSFDNREWGRNYEITEEQGCIIVKFTKLTDFREDKSNGNFEFSLFLVIKGNFHNYKKNNSWIEKIYKTDWERNSGPFSRFVYNGLRLFGSKFVFSFSKDKTAAISECHHVYEQIDYFKKLEEKQFSLFLNFGKIKEVCGAKNIPDDCKMAYTSAAHSMKNLLVEEEKNSGLLAGLPWFYQFWLRDTLISVKSLYGIYDKPSEQILMRYLDKITDDGRLPNIDSNESGQMTNADGHGWLFLRLSQIIDSANHGKNFDEIHKFRYMIESAMEKSLHGTSKYHSKDGFETNRERETWMDTDFGIDFRDGARIEIQCLKLATLKFLHSLTQEPKYRIMENVLLQKVREKFWNGKILADGLGDFTIRPNIFIAAYAYPELLSQKEWEMCFENSLKALWLEWGGVSTIDRKNPLFTQAHSGENNKSYHRGDSWFWINSLAALVLFRTNGKKFKKEIHSILSASTSEILWSGCIGCHSELSSSKELRSEGCFNQAWSNAMFME